MKYLTTTMLACALWCAGCGEPLTAEQQIVLDYRMAIDPHLDRDDVAKEVKAISAPDLKVQADRAMKMVRSYGSLESAAKSVRLQREERKWMAGHNIDLGMFLVVRDKWLKKSGQPEDGERKFLAHVKTLTNDQVAALFNR